MTGMGNHYLREVLKLWIKLDKLLSGEGVKILDFAREEGISHHTARRYIELLAAQLGCARNYTIEGRKWVWRYTDGAGPLFTVNLVPGKGQKKKGKRPQEE